MCNRLFHHFYKLISIFFCMLLFCCLPLAEAQNVVVSSSVEEQSAPASTALDELLARYPAGSIHTTEDANRAGDDVHKMHTLIEAQFAEEQKICYPRFFATSCLNDAKEHHRVALTKVRAIEIEVNKFKRRANVIARDKAQAAKHDKEAAELAAKPKENQEPIANVVPESSQAASAAKPQAKNDNRIVKHQIEAKKRQEAEAENAKQRASHIAAYEKKRQESEARQREIAAKKLEKARVQSSKDASATK
jgi:colicin import membrane protein